MDLNVNMRLSRILGSENFLRRSRPGSSSARGFTLIELLVVIAIIGVLAGLALGALSRVRRRSQIQRTQAAITTLELAIESYADDFHDYPDSGGGDGITGSENLLKALMTDEKNGPYIDKKAVPSIVDHNNNDLQEIGDTWGKPIQYLHKKDFGREGPNKNSFRLFSAGPDGRYEPLNTESDDIVNWDKKDAD